MLGRIVAQKPWIFREFAGLPPIEIDYAEVWDRLCQYTLEDLPAERAYGRMKEFTAYYAHNFFFGNQLIRATGKARTVYELRDAALGFLNLRPQIA
jgi:tRNA-dihydrouridine synthase